MSIGIDRSADFHHQTPNVCPFVNCLHLPLDSELTNIHTFIYYHSLHELLTQTSQLRTGQPSIGLLAIQDWLISHVLQNWSSQ